MVLGIGLGGWQWQRADEKRAYLARLESAPTLEAPRRTPPEGATIVLEGTYLSEHSLWLDNRTLDGRVGVAALTPLRTDDGRLWLVERGFVATGASREDPGLETPEGRVAVRGNWQAAGDEPWIYGDNRQGRRLQRIELAAWSSLDGFAHDGWLHLQEGPGMLAPWWRPSVMPPSRHRGYAFQWWGLALAALAVMLLGGRCLHRETRGQGPEGRQRSEP